MLGYIFDKRDKVRHNVIYILRTKKLLQVANTQRIIPLTPMKEFINYILQFGNLNQQQIDFISKANELELAKTNIFAEAGKVLNQVGLLQMALSGFITIKMAKNGVIY
jgi:hypothetical protein